MKNPIFKGSCVALITPFKENEVDYEALGKVLDYQLKNKTDAILILGTTGEPATMTPEEKAEIIYFAKKKIGDKAKLIVGTGGNNTSKVIEDSLLVKKYGADALLIVTPYYNKCTQSGLVKHYEMIAQNVEMPIIVYNVPGRTGVNILPETALKLSEIPEICGIKEASGNISQIITLCHLLKDKMPVYSGDDSLNYVFMSLGAMGCISVTANVVPDLVKKAMDSYLNGDHATALAMHEKLLQINKDMFVEVNPIPVKYACYKLGLCKNILRLPLTKLEKANEKVVDESLKNLNLINTTK